MLIPFLLSSVVEKKSVFTITPRSKAIALAVECHMFELIVFIDAPNANQSTNLSTNPKFQNFAPKIYKKRKNESTFGSES